MKKKDDSGKYLFLLPVLLLLGTRGGIELFIRILPAQSAWIPSFGLYYILIASLLIIATKKKTIDLQSLSFRFKPSPNWKNLLFLIIVPGLLPLPVFILHIKEISLPYLLYICIFSCINPVFEELFWRGLLYFAPGKKSFTVLFSAVMFSFSHYFLWGSYWFKNPYVLFPTLFSTFLMGLLWMWFVQKQKNIIYPIISHLLVDFFNLSVAAYSGIIFKIN